MLTAQNVKDAFERYKRDISDVSDTTLLEWIKFITRYGYEEIKGVDPTRFIKTQSYYVVENPQTESLPSDYMDMNQTTTGLYFYDTRDRSIVTFDETGDSDITFSDTGGTSAYNSSVHVKGGSSRGFTGDAAASMLLTFGTAIDWTDFDDGGTDSTTSDYVSIWVYIGNSIPTSVTIELSTTAADIDVNEYSYEYTSLVAGWNHVLVAKSDFTSLGSPSWDSLAFIRLTHTGGDATTNVYWDKMELVEANGDSETSNKLGVTGYGSTNEGYYLTGADNIVFTGIEDKDYVMRYMPQPPAITALTDSLSVDKTATGVPVFEDRHLEYLVKATDVLYEQWDDNPSSESLADFRFTRIMEDMLSKVNRVPQVSYMRNPISDY